jgi:tetratricopeptide (TPR) repeat protein
MIPSIWTRKRRLVPRWRRLAVTAKARELATPPRLNESSSALPIDRDLLDKLGRWRADQSIVSAGELVEAAVVAAKESEAAHAARFLLDPRSTATAPLKRLAALTLKRAGYENEVPSGLEILASDEKRVWRERTRMYPNNPLGWVELSLFDVIAGRHQSALRSMQIALQLAPNDRHVLRSASRLFLHLGDPDRAYDILLRSAATKSDPWLIAAELSIAELAGQKPRYFEQGRRLVEQGQFYPRQITELSGAIATLELEAGRRKKSRDFFRTSLTDPSGNAVAQAEWASPEFNVELVSPQTFSTASEVDEATAFHLLREKKFGEVPAACERWSQGEPYSIRPFEVGSSTAAMIGDHEKALKLAQQGLLVRPNAKLLLNNQAFSLAHLGRLKEAEQSLRGIGQEDERLWLVSQANRGLISMRSGQHQAGMTYYREAIEGFKKLEKPQMIAIARLYLGREAARAGLPEAGELLTSAREALEKLKMTAHQHILEEAEKALSQSNEVPTDLEASI